MLTLCFLGFLDFFLVLFFDISITIPPVVLCAIPLELFSLMLFVLISDSRYNNNWSK